MKNLSATGFLNKEELEQLPGVPTGQVLTAKKTLVFIECSEEIPCDPCQSACPRGAISVSPDITSLPALNTDLCSGCGACITACPGMAIFLVDFGYSETEALVSIPYEYLPLPETGDTVNALDRSGKVIGKAVIVKVKCPESYDRTAIITIKVLKDISLEARHIDI